MTPIFLKRPARTTKALIPVEQSAYAAWLEDQPAAVRNWLANTGFAARPGQIGAVATGDGGIDFVVVGVTASEAIWSYGGLARGLAAGSYRIDADLGPAAATAAATGWALGAYRFDRYRTAEAPAAKLVWPKGVDRAAVERTVAATTLVRDLVNTPASDMGPPELATAARRLARRHRARCRVVSGGDLLRRNFPAIHAVGRAASKAPRLIDLSWGRRDAPRVTIAGKGVCFDTGGLDIKSAAGMRLMKKDMGGAAHALGLAHMIMAADLDVRLRVLIPAVENTIAGNAVYPLDVVRSRSGRTIEIGHTDAEGRVVLSDALTEACREKPDLLIDFATLTGAARVALGPEVAAMFSNDDDLASAIGDHAVGAEDPVWRLPLWQPYGDYNKSDVADISNDSNSRFGGAIAAALFLESFVESDISWVHFDIMAWNVRDRAGRPKGGEAMAMRAMFGVVAERYPPRRKRSRAGADR
ncbi:MAG: leucyl aminopeptidase family protein [Alphaproteobacteria bacterium]|nr:leucyl aminopeptidase family protein [Alphaproteobacteria bacterium]